MALEASNLFKGGGHNVNGLHAMSVDVYDLFDMRGSRRWNECPSGEARAKVNRRHSKLAEVLPGDTRTMILHRTVGRKAESLNDIGASADVCHDVAGAEVVECHHVFFRNEGRIGGLGVNVAVVEVQLQNF